MHRSDVTCGPQMAMNAMPMTTPACAGNSSSAAGPLSVSPPLITASIVSPVLLIDPSEHQSAKLLAQSPVSSSSLVVNSISDCSSKALSPAASVATTAIVVAHPVLVSTSEPRTGTPISSSRGHLNIPAAVRGESFAST